MWLSRLSTCARLTAQLASSKHALRSLAMGAQSWSRGVAHLPAARQPFSRVVIPDMSLQQRRHSAWGLGTQQRGIVTAVQRKGDELVVAVCMFRLEVFFDKICLLLF